MCLLREATEEEAMLELILDLELEKRGARLGVESRMQEANSSAFPLPPLPLLLLLPSSASCFLLRPPLVFETQSHCCPRQA